MQAREAKQTIVIAEGAHSVSALLSQLNKLKQVYSNSDNTYSEQRYFADWSNHIEESICNSFTDDAIHLRLYTEEEAFKAVAGPRKFDMALGNKDWGDAARTE